MIWWMEDRIQQTGPVPFSTYMDWSLYDSEYGYYTSNREVFGTQGDFYTSPSVHSVFAETIADWIYTVWNENQQDQALRIVEMGAGTGQLAEGIIKVLTSKNGIAPFDFSYIIIERSIHLQQVQQERLSVWASYVNWQPSLTDLEPAATFLLSNELLDAFPVDLFRKNGAKWEMQYIYLDDKTNKLQSVWFPADEQSEQYLTHLNGIPDGCICELNKGLHDWVRDVNRMIREGYVLTIDYGGDTDELYGEHHPEGTIRTFFQHQVSGNVLEAPGYRDLTADVDFTYLESWTSRFGWLRERYETQGQFLVHAGILNKLKDTAGSISLHDPIRKTNSAIKHLILPGGMGDAFRVTLHRLPADRD